VLDSEQPADHAADGVQGHELRTNLVWYTTNGGVRASVLGDHERVHIQVFEHNTVDNARYLAIQSLWFF